MVNACIWRLSFYWYVTHIVILGLQNRQCQLVITQTVPGRLLSFANALELMQSCTKPSKWPYFSSLFLGVLPVLSRLMEFIYLHSHELFHYHWHSCMITPVHVTQTWRIWVKLIMSCVVAVFWWLLHSYILHIVIALFCFGVVFHRSVSTIYFGLLHCYHRGNE